MNYFLAGIKSGIMSGIISKTAEMQNCDLNSTDVNSATRNLHQKHAHELHSYSQQNIHLSGKALLIVTRKVSQSQAKHRLVMVLVRSKKSLQDHNVLQDIF